MKITNIRLQEETDSVLLVADILPRNSKKAFNLWYKAPKQYKEYISITANPFIAAILLQCMWEEEDIYVDGVVSEFLVSDLDVLMDYHVLGDKELSKVKIKAKHQLRSADGGLSAGSFFSGGVDSFYTLTKNHDKYKKEHRDPIKYLLLVRGFDIANQPEDDSLWRETKNTVELVAKRTKTKTIPIETNTREHFGPANEWRKKPYKEMWAKSLHGSLLCSVGLVFGKLFKQVYIPSSASYRSLIPYGSHPLTDPLWSTETTTFIHDGTESTRSGKISKIVSSKYSKLFFNNLRVCWQNPDKKYNCGVCEKCLRTKAALDSLGVLEKTKTLPGNVDYENIKHDPEFSSESRKQFYWEELAKDAQNFGNKEFAKRIFKILEDKENYK